MLYQMDQSLNAIAEFKRVMQAAGLISNIYYETTSWLIFSTPRSNKVIKVSGTLTLFVGDSWTSTTTITNEVAVNVPFNGSWASGSAVWLIVTPDILCLTSGHPTSTTYCNFWALCKLDNGDNIIIGSTASSQDGGNSFSRWFNTTDNEHYSPTFSPYGLMTDANNYYNTFDLPFKSAGTNLYRPGVLMGAKFLFKAPSLNEAIQIFNPDIVVSFRFFKHTSWLDFQCSLLILNGNI